MASIASDIIRGHTDTIILRFLMERDSYGYEINRNIRRLTDDAYELNEATLYTAFRRLETGGFISSYWGSEGSGASRSGASRSWVGELALRSTSTPRNTRWIR